MTIQQKGVSKVWENAAKRSARLGKTTDPRRAKRKCNILIAAERKDVRDGYTEQSHSMAADFLKLKRKFSDQKSLLRHRRRTERVLGKKGAM